MCEKHGEHSIELDCPPGSPRPGDLIAGVIKDTGLSKKPPVSTCFGNWIWKYDEVNCDQWDKIVPILAERIKSLYNDGSIRYGSW
jgi:hypothetical protein